MDNITDDDRKKCANKPDMELWDKPVPMSVDIGCGKGFSGIISNPLTGHAGYFDGCHRHRHTARGKAAVKVGKKNGPAWDDNCDGGKNYFIYMARQFNDSVGTNKSDRKYEKMVLFGTRLVNFVQGMYEIKHPAFFKPEGWWNQIQIWNEKDKKVPVKNYMNDSVMEWMDILKKNGWGGPGDPDTNREGGPKRSREERQKREKIAAEKSGKAIKNWKMAAKAVLNPSLAQVAKLAQEAKEEEEAMKSYKEFTETSVRRYNESGKERFWTWEELSDKHKKQWKEKNHGKFGERLMKKEEKAKLGQVPYENYVNNESPFTKYFGKGFHKPWSKLTKRAQNDWEGPLGYAGHKGGEHGYMLKRRADKFIKYCGPNGTAGRHRSVTCDPENDLWETVSKWTWTPGAFYGGKRRRRTKKKRKRRRKRTNKKKKRRRKRTKKKRR